MNPIDEPQGSGPPPAGSASRELSFPSPTAAIEATRRRFGNKGKKPPPGPPAGGGDGGDEDEDGMLRMSFLQHLEELRSRIIKTIIGIAVAFFGSLLFSHQLWNFVRQPAAEALTSLGYGPDLTQIEPMEVFNIVWFKLPIVCAIFLSCPWIVYQLWAFISPGLYKRERRWAAPFILSAGGLFIVGGLFAYFIVFRYALTFLLGLGRENYVVPMVTITEYFDLFVNVVLGIGLVFEMPVIIFFLALLRIVTPAFLVKHSRYAILIIFIIAAVVTPTPDVINLMLFALPMCALYYVGVFASYLLVLHREKRKFPWRVALPIVLGVLLLLGGLLFLAITRYGYKLVPHWPFLIR